MHAADVIRQAINLLLRIVLARKQHITSRINQRRPFLQDRKITIFTPAHIHTRQRYQVDHVAPAVAHFEQRYIAKHEPVRRRLP